MSSASLQCRLLASVDLVGSTAFKATKESILESWSPVFESFFADFPPRLDKCGRELLKEHRTLLSEPELGGFQVWKFVGDEVLLDLLVCKPSEVAWGLRTLLRAVAEYEQVLVEQTEGQLRLKATAWLANFPVPNAEVDVPQRDSGNTGGFVVRDYLGPGIDLGFRLAKSADLRRVPVSASLAQVVASLNEPRMTGNELHLAYSGREVMKGVNLSRPYPIFWLDRSPEAQTLEDKLTRIEHRVTPGHALDFLDEFFNSEDTTEPVCLPGSGNESRFFAPTSKLKKLHEKYLETDPDPSYRTAVENAEIAQKEGATSDLPDVEILFSNKPKRRRRRRKPGGGRKTN